MFKLRCKTGNASNTIHSHV